jgi:hypothetical protein
MNINFSIGSEETVSDTFMERPSVATDSKCQPHFVCDAGGNTRFMKFHRINGKWSGGVFATGSKGGQYDASRLYVGQIEIDANDRAWISCKFGVKEFGAMYGQGLWLYKKIANNPKRAWFRFVCVYKGMGLVSLDPSYPDEGVILGTYGNFNVLDAKGALIRKGSINGGPGGEKVRFRISFNGTWHTVMNGWSKMSSAYQNDVRWEETQGAAPLIWADYKLWPQQGKDFCHPGIGVDLVNPNVCYMAGIFGSKLVYNVYDGKKMLYGSRGAVLDTGAVSETRHGPAFAPIRTGGSLMFWGHQGGLVYSALGSVQANPYVATEAQLVAENGRSPAACTDREGNIHLVYKVGGSIKYRKILVTA